MKQDLLPGSTRFGLDNTLASAVDGVKLHFCFNFFQERLGFKNRFDLSGQCFDASGMFDVVLLWFGSSV